jgi:hypothetical protein
VPLPSPCIDELQSACDAIREVIEVFPTTDSYVELLDAMDADSKHNLMRLL